ncbi:lantibiotic ABC transporter permease [Paenibacillus albidus]|uniref:Lantibiotic ABC transporter permease n=1 Tax=Paenibacillus albidus TaxID=2041023 RepID=A0A917CFK4_9BACL|nr:ABC transporter permease [Paenibacillus albidus]GGF87535.1 lantibiotic ABC transporter permease [Paenibacillus albidus]
MLYNEWLKFRRSGLFWTLPVVGLFSPLLFMSLRLSEKLRFADSQTMPWLDYFGNEKMFYCFFIVLIWMGLIAGQLISREYTDHTVSILYTYPASRISIILSKTVMVGFIVLLCQAFEFTGLYFTSWIYKGEVMPAQILVQELQRTGISLLGQLALVPLFVWLSQLGRSILLPIIAAIGLMITNPMVTAINTSSYSPFSMYVSSYISIISGSPALPVGRVLLVDLMMFVVTMSILLFHTVKMEIRS